MTDDVRLVIRDATGQIVRTLSGPSTPGLHRVPWDLETDEAKAAMERGADSFRGLTLSERQQRRRVAPGTYRVTLETEETSMTRSIEVRAERADRVRRVWPR